LRTLLVKTHLPKASIDTSPEFEI
jgi:hypothetical protein